MLLFCGKHRYEDYEILEKRLEEKIGVKIKRTNIFPNVFNDVYKVFLIKNIIIQTINPQNVLLFF